MKIPEESTFCTRCGEKIQHASSISNKMLILAFCAAALSLSVAALSFFKDSLMAKNRNSANPPGISGLSLPTATISPKATPTLPAVVVETAKSPKPSPTLEPSPPESSRKIVSTNLELKRREFRPYRFIVEESLQIPTITGKISVEDGRDVELLIVDDQGLQDFSNSGYLNRGIPNQYRVRVTSFANISIPINRPGTYYVILSNHHAIIRSKSVKADLSLEYQ